MASLFIKDGETADIVSRVAKRLGLSKTALVRELAIEREAKLDRVASAQGFDDRLAALYRRFPPSAPATAPDHKPFFDAMWSESD